MVSTAIKHYSEEGMNALAVASNSMDGKTKTYHARFQTMKRRYDCTIAYREQTICDGL